MHALYSDSDNISHAHTPFCVSTRARRHSDGARHAVIVEHVCASEGDELVEWQRGEVHAAVKLAKRDEREVARGVDVEARGVLQPAPRGEGELEAALGEAELRRERADAKGRRAVEAVEDSAIERRHVLDVHRRE